MQNNTHIALAIAAALIAAPATSTAANEQNDKQRPALPVATTSLNVCVHTKSGEITVVAAASGCRRNEQFLNIPISRLIGPEGPQGPLGPIGAQGPQGLKGDTGGAGARGEIGDAGATGPVGPAGAKGAIGPQGPKGLQGAQGAIGDQGSAGPAGVAGGPGAQGPNGFQGPQGPQGAPGNPGAWGLFRYDLDLKIPDAGSLVLDALDVLMGDRSGESFACHSGAQLMGMTASPVHSSVLGETIEFDLSGSRPLVAWWNNDLFVKNFRVTMWCAWTR